MITIERKVHFRTGRGNRKKLRAGTAAAKPTAVVRVPRISRLMALAIKFDGLVRSGQIRDYAELARLAQVSRTRITQIMNLLNLSPEIQEEILFFVHSDLSTRVRMRDLQSVAGNLAWSGQELA